MIIVLRKIKRIRELSFQIPAKGVSVITGLNGSGKTSLFASIYRIGAKHAFQKFFRTSRLELRLDSYENAEIEYQINGEVVKYHYGGLRWRATPRRNANLFEQSPYASIDYIEASGDRIEPYSDEIQPRRLKNASDEVKQFLVDVLTDGKWNDLKYVNTRRGVGSLAYLIPYQVGGRNYYYSEKSFSLGELCTLKLARKICTAPQNSLLLIDEVEMALHPQAQVKLLRAVQKIAEDKDLTVLFSTHSATLIKNVGRKNLIHLKSDTQGNVSTSVGVFPAQVLGDIAFDDELLTDFVFYVEDKQAKLLVEQMFGMYMAHCHPNSFYRPLYKVAPVGGFVQVLEMLNSSSGIFPNHVKRFALLDQDVKTESLAEARRQQNQILLNLFNTASGKVDYLPCTPEVGVIEMLEGPASQDVLFMNELNGMFNGHHLGIGSLISAADYILLNKANPREKAKDRLNNLVGKISVNTGSDEIHVRRTMYNQYVKYKYANDIGALRALLGPMFNAR